MKKLTLMAAVSLALLGTATSCSKGDSPSSERYSAEVATLFTDEATGEATASLALYDFNYNLSDATMYLRIKDLKVGDNTLNVQSSDDIAFKKVAFTNGATLTTFAIPQMGNGGSNDITNLDASVYTVFNYNPTLQMVTSLWRHFEISFNIGKYKAQTFDPSCYFGGTTMSTYISSNNEHKEYSNSNVLYLLVMDIPEKKADVVIYNAQFASEMPAIAQMRLKNLDLTFSNGAYTISGTDKVPYVIEGGGETPNERFVFNNFTFRTTNQKLTTGQLTFKVAGRFDASANLNLAI